MNLSPHFTLAEFTRSDTAKAKGIDNQPGAVHLANLTALARTLEQVRKLLGSPIIITSGYRSPALNKAVDGSDTSSHSHGLAADFHCPGYGNDLQVCDAIVRAGIRFDQIIYEQSARGNTWVHLGIGDKMRGEVLSWRSGRGYRHGLTKI